eukprot:scaffold146_cov265-Pinguiococcus_pyrenoidosus.AAC.29
MVPADLFWNTFYGIVALCIAVHLYTRRPNKDKSKVVSAMKPPPGFKQFQRSFLAVTLLAMLADWLQGPYVYKLYHDYGYDQGDIGLLFVAGIPLSAMIQAQRQDTHVRTSFCAGFLSSAIFGTIAGGMADVLGRKKACQVRQRDAERRLRAGVHRHCAHKAVAELLRAFLRAHHRWSGHLAAVHELRKLDGMSPAVRRLSLALRTLLPTTCKPPPLGQRAF